MKLASNFLEIFYLCFLLVERFMSLIFYNDKCSIDENLTKNLCMKLNFCLLLFFLNCQIMLYFTSLYVLEQKRLQSFWN